MLPGSGRFVIGEAKNQKTKQMKVMELGPSIILLSLIFFGSLSP